MVSSFALRNITSRTALPNACYSAPSGYKCGSDLASTYYGPSFTATTTQGTKTFTYSLGAFLEDYEYYAGTGDLDEHNGRWCVTPEYPNGTYAYFVTVDASGNPAFPYSVRLLINIFQNILKIIS